MTQHQYWQNSGIVPAEDIQAEGDDRSYRAKAWTAMICGVAGFWVVVGAVVWSAL